ncbi:MAG: BufA2 family periplasmic bufferin-type metallophore [Bacteriovorax sp.]
MDSRNLLLAAALSGLALTVSASESVKTPAPTKEAKAVEGQCFGINTCKGTSACHSDQNACATRNSCKGKGWLKTSEKACKDKKGTFKKA